MAKVLIYYHSEQELSSRRAGSVGVDFAQAFGWDDLSRSLNEKESIELVILDSVSSETQPEITRRIKRIKDIPVLFFEQTAAAAGSSTTPTSKERPPTHMLTQDECDDRLTREDDPLEKARQFLDDNFKRQLTLAQIAEVAEISPSYFCRKFKTKFGISPITYLRNLRIDRACHLLEHTNLQLAQITDQSGFFSIPYFCREFRKVKGVSPIQYRRKGTKTKRDEE